MAAADFEGMEDEAGLSRGVDFISQLPESLIHYILSFLPLKYILITSILSKTWNNIFKSYNALVFDFIYDAYVRNNLQCNSQSDMLHTYLTLMDDKVCCRFKQAQDTGNRVQTFNMAVNFPDFNLFIPRLNFWLSTAIENNVLEVYLKLTDQDEYKPKIWYTVPEFLLVATQLSSLELYMCRVECTAFTKLDRLRKLDLTEVFFGDDYMFQNLSVCCPLIEHLSLKGCRGITKLSSVSSLPQLRHLDLSMCYVLSAIQIEAPSLQTFIYCATIQHRGVQCKINLIGASSSLKVLKLRAIEITPLSFKNLLSEHPCIEHLILMKCKFLSSFKMSSENLKCLVLRDCPFLNTVCIKTPNLYSVDHDNPSTILTFMNFKSLCKIHIQLEFASLYAHLWSNLKTVLTKTCYFADLKLALKSKKPWNNLAWQDHSEEYNDPQDVVVHNQMSAVSFSGKHSLKKLLKKSNPYVLISSYSYTYILDDLFDYCYPRTLSLVCPDSIAKSIFDDVMAYHRNWSRRSRHSHYRAERLWEGRFRDFEVDSSEGAVELMCAPLRSFLRGHSIRGSGFKATTFKLRWFKPRPNS